MKVCILSDSHDHRDLLIQAVRDAKERGAKAVLHCGDVVAPSTLGTLVEFGLPVHVVEGNNGGDIFHLCALRTQTDGLIQFHGRDARLTLAGRRVFLVHFPHYAYGMACTGDWDLVCCGHDHRFESRRVPTVMGGETVLLNPGTVGGVGAPPSYVFGDLSSMDFALQQFAEARNPA
ncbi:MAG: metallophosphoesterase family protein [Acidiferrobacteraceae bacterium]